MADDASRGSPFEFATAGRIVFGRGALSRLGALARELGTRALVVTGKASRFAEQATALLETEQVQAAPYAVGGEPTLDAIRRGVEQARRAGADLVVGVGGGSALDSAKAIAALAHNDGDPLDYLEVVGKSRKLERPCLACIAVPTTAGTGSEVTRNAVLEVPEQRVKVSLRSQGMLPSVALVDSTLTHGVPPDVTAATGFDALTQIIEPFVSHASTVMTDALCREALPRAAVALPRVCADGTDSEARDQMSLVSLFGGLCLANAKLGAVHGLAGPLGGMYRAPHGALCAALLPHVMRANVSRLRENETGSRTLARYQEIARSLTARPDAEAEDGIAWVEALREASGIPSLGRLGVRAEDFDVISGAASRASSMAGNPVTFSHEDLCTLLSRAL